MRSKRRLQVSKQGDGGGGGEGGGTSLFSARVLAAGKELRSDSIY